MLTTSSRERERERESYFVANIDRFLISYFFAYIAKIYRLHSQNVSHIYPKCNNLYHLLSGNQYHFLFQNLTLGKHKVFITKGTFSRVIDSVITLVLLAKLNLVPMAKIAMNIEFGVIRRNNV